MRSKLSINVYFPYNWKSCIQYSYTSILFHSPSKSPIFNHIIRQKYRNYTLTTRWIETYLHLFKISTITKKNSKFHNPSPDEERLKIQQPRRITTNRRVRWITSLLSFSFPTKIRPPRGAIYEFTPQMRIMALIRDIWLEHCRGSPHACPRTTLCTVVSHRWCNRNPYIHICSDFRLSTIIFRFTDRQPIPNSLLLPPTRFPSPHAIQQRAWNK